MAGGGTTDLVTDGCTLWFDGAWRHCCDAHDLAYSQFADKLQSDLDLALCVAKTGHGAVALVMLAGVLLFGWLFYPKKRRP